MLNVTDNLYKVKALFFCIEKIELLFDDLFLLKKLINKEQVKIISLLSGGSNYLKIGSNGSWIVCLNLQDIQRLMGFM